MTATARRSEPRLKVAAAPTAPVKRAPKIVKDGVVDQVRLALRPKNRLATALGCLLGGFVPLATWVVAHRELDLAQPLYLQLATLFVLGGLLYSATTVYTWGRQAFQSAPKALGFVLLTEGVLVASSVSWLGVAALGLLIAINGIATGVNLSRGAPCSS